MTSSIVGNFYYFAYGTFVDPTNLKAALSKVLGGGAPPTILRSHPAVLPGYRLTLDAVSAEGPRLGRLNIAPYSLLPRQPTHGKAKSDSKANGSSNDRATTVADACLSAFKDGVRGILYELPANLRAPLLQAVSQEGSFNRYAMLTCYELNDVRHGVRDADAPIHEALVIAALDLPLLEHKFLLEKTMRLRWMVLPPPQGVAVPPGLLSTSLAGVPVTPASAPAEGAAAPPTPSEAADKAATFRWPGLHWCNCVNSTRVAPSCAYAAMIEHAYTAQLLLLNATDEDAEAQEKKKPQVASEGGAESVSYGQAIYRMVYASARDVATDPQERKTWYLAYGSNLSWEQVCLRIGPPYQRRAVKLANYVLVPNTTARHHHEYASFGYYNVEPVAMRADKAAKGLVKHRSTMPDYVCGAAYEISMAQLEMMDGFEGGYDRELLRCTDLRDPAAAPWDCWTYIARDTSEEVMPSREYLSRVLEGADILPLEYMEGIRATPTNPLRSPRQDRRLRKEL